MNDAFGGFVKPLEPCHDLPAALGNDEGAVSRLDNKAGERRSEERRSCETVAPGIAWPFMLVFMLDMSLMMMSDDCFKLALFI